MITLQTEMEREPVLTIATLINHVVRDLLYQHKFNYAHFPEIVDLAVVGSGLGVLQSNIGFVNNSGSFWDSTHWEFPRPFLDTQSLAYASALTAWVRGENQPKCANDLPSDVKRSMQKSFKYLLKTNDSFFDASSANRLALGQSQYDWMELANDPSPSKQVVAIRHLEFNEQLTGQQESMFLEKLRSNNRAIVLHSIDATQRLMVANEPVVEELRLLVENRDDEIRAKAMLSLTRLSALDQSTVLVAANMLDNKAKFIVYAGLIALSSLDSVPEPILQPVNRGFIGALQNCNYEFVGLFVAAFNRWLDVPENHFETLLANDSPEYLEIAMEALQNVREQIVDLV